MEFKKGQAAMEYLMTYGWAILVIVIVLAALLYLGVFNVSPPETCMFSPGISCKTFYLDTGGDLSLTVVNGLQKPIVLTGFKCTQESATPSAFDAVNDTVAVGGEYSIPASIQCYDASGAAIGSHTAGTAYNGKLYLEYYYQGEPSANTRLISGTIYVKAA